KPKKDPAKSGEPLPIDAPPERDENETIGWNVAAVLPGGDPTLSQEFVVFGAHYDHLGVRRGQLHPGADDNASGVSALLEAARVLAAQKPAPKRSVLFIAFDLEEQGLFGSQHFVAAPPCPLASIKLFLNADMIGRDAGGVIEPFVFVIGSERAPELRQTVETARTESALQVGWLRADLIGPRSDHYPFEAKRVPFLFFCTGEHPDYHSPADVPERLNHEKHARIARLMTRTLLASANAEAAPAWRDEAVVDLEEVRTACRVLDALLATPGVLKEGTFQRGLAANTRSTLQGYLDRGNITAAERTWLVSMCKVLLESL
ncbi:MAG TPA: M20/M25/M40 family metallo-hydrolase, partial [Pirellulales bacterium]